MLGSVAGSSRLLRVDSSMSSESMRLAVERSIKVSMLREDSGRAAEIARVAQRMLSKHAADGYVCARTFPREVGGPIAHFFSSTAF